MSSSTTEGSPRGQSYEFSASFATLSRHCCEGPYLRILYKICEGPLGPRASCRLGPPGAPRTPFSQRCLLSRHEAQADNKPLFAQLRFVTECAISNDRWSTADDN